MRVTFLRVNKKRERGRNVLDVRRVLPFHPLLPSQVKYCGEDHMFIQDDDLVLVYRGPEVGEVQCTF